MRKSVSKVYAALPHVIYHPLDVLIPHCHFLWWCPCRLPWDPPAADDGSAQVPLGQAGRARGAAGLLPAAEWHPGGALQERCGEELFSWLMSFNFTCGQTARSRTPSISKWCILAVKFTEQQVIIVLFLIYFITLPTSSSLRLPQTPFLHWSPLPGCPHCTVHSAWNYPPLPLAFTLHFSLFS